MEAVEGQNVESAQAKQESVTAEEFKALQEKLEQLSQTNARLLDESKQYKSKWQETRSAIEEREQKEAESSNNLEKLLELERNKRHEIENKYKETRRETLKKELNFQVAKYAQDAYSVDDVIGAALGTGIVELDEDNLSVKNVKEAIDLVRDQKFYLFNKGNSPKMFNQAPTSQKPDKPLSRNEAMAEAMKVLIKR